LYETKIVADSENRKCAVMWRGRGKYPFRYRIQSENPSVATPDVRRDGGEEICRRFGSIITRKYIGLDKTLGYLIISKLGNLHYGIIYVGKTYSDGPESKKKNEHLDEDTGMLANGGRNPFVSFER
jgi:hypothetical protein